MGCVCVCVRAWSHIVLVVFAGVFFDSVSLTVPALPQMSVVSQMVFSYWHVHTAFASDVGVPIEGGGRGGFSPSWLPMQPLWPDTRRLKSLWRFLLGNASAAVSQLDFSVWTTEDLLNFFVFNANNSFLCVLCQNICLVNWKASLRNEAFFLLAIFPSCVCRVAAFFSALSENQISLHCQRAVYYKSGGLFFCCLTK